jgi:hypothetical protein
MWVKGNMVRFGWDCTNDKSTSFGLKHGYQMHKGETNQYIFSVEEGKCTKYIKNV